MSTNRQADLKATVLAAAGLFVLATLPTMRPDLLLLGLAAAVVGMAWRPGVGPLLVGLAIPFYFFSQSFGRLAVSPPGLAIVLAWAAVFLRLAWRAVRRQPIDLRWPTTGYDGPLALFLLAALLSLLVTEYLLLSARELRALIFEPVAFFWLLAVLRNHRAERWALAGLLASGVLVAAVAVSQSVLGEGGTLAEGVRRAQAWYPQPNHLALFVGRACPFFLALAFVGPGRVAARLLGGAGALLTAAALFATFSLGAWIGAAAAILVMLALAGQRRLAVGLGVAAILAFLALSVLGAAGLVPERLDPGRQTTGFRVELWLSSLAMVRDHPLLGVGLDNFVYQYQQVYLREGASAEANLSHPHNWVLHFWLQMGLLGLVAFLWLLWRAATYLRQALATSAASRWLAVGAGGSLTAMLVHGSLDNSYFLPDLALIFWLTLAVLAGMARLSPPPEAADPSQAAARPVSRPVV